MLGSSQLTRADYLYLYVIHYGDGHIHLRSLVSGRDPSFNRPAWLQFYQAGPGCNLHLTAESLRVS
jgi:hypothetical protein